MAVTSSSLSSGASIAAGSALVVPPTITRADLSPIRPNTRPIEDTRGITGYRFPADIGKYYMKIEISDYTRLSLDVITSGGFGISGGPKRILTNTDNVILPLPANLVDNNSTAFSEDSMGDVVGGVVDAAAGVAGAAVDYLTAGVGGDIASSFTKNLAKIGYAAAGVAPNKFMTIVLQGPQYKKHSFSWKFYPKTSQESIDLNRIVNLLKKSMRTSLGDANLFFKFPKVFQLSFVNNSNFLYEFKPAVMESISVNYTPSGSPNFYGKTGAPDGITLTMNFWELEYWLSTDEPDRSRPYDTDRAPITGSMYDPAAIGAGIVPGSEAARRAINGSAPNRFGG
jgi:hypothetical protein